MKEDYISSLFNQNSDPLCKVFIFLCVHYNNKSYAIAIFIFFYIIEQNCIIIKIGAFIKNKNINQIKSKQNLKALKKSLCHIQTKKDVI